LSTKNDIARRRAEAIFAACAQRTTEELAHKKTVDAHLSLLARIAEQRALRLAKEKSGKHTCNETL
jgi:hypothetical protein